MYDGQIQIHIQIEQALSFIYSRSHLPVSPRVDPEWSIFVFTQLIIAYTCFTFNFRLLTDALVLLFVLNSEFVWFSCCRIISPSIVAAHS